MPRRVDGSSDSDCDDVAPAQVEIAVQLSRFHLETLEGSATGDIDVRGLQLSVADKELVVDAHLSLKAGTRYGLVGRNGTGKSTLLKALANKSIPGLPRDMKIMYVQQENVPGDDRSALQTVLDAAAGQRRVVEERVAELEAALDELEAEGEGEREAEGEGEGEGEGDGSQGGDRPDGAGDGGAEGGDGEGGGGQGTGAGACRRPLRGTPAQRRVVAAVRAVLASRADEQAAEADLIAARRSRLRGKEATKTAVAARDQARRTRGEELSPHAAASLAPQLLAELYEQLEVLAGGGSEEQEALAGGAVLEGLGFAPQQVAAATNTLSGGWRMRVALACALLAQPHVLLLDEPTNHLDIASILWLQDYLVHRSPPRQTLLLVSHDRAFLNAVATETVLLRDAKLTYFIGTYDAYLQAKAEASVHKERQVAGQERHRAHYTSSIAKAEKAAREAGDDKRLLQAASRKKKLDRLGADKTADGKKFKVSYWAGYHETLRPQVELDKPEEPVVIQLPPPEALRQRGPLLQLRDVTIAYGSCTAAVAAAVGAAAAAAAGGDGTQRGGAAGAPGAAGGGRGSAKGPPKSKAALAAAEGEARAAAAATAAALTAAGVVLRGVTLDVEPGARIGLLGLNGSGKSSLMRVLAGELPPALGEVVRPCPRLLLGCLDQHSGRRLLQQAEQLPPPAAAVSHTPFSVVQARAPLLKPQEVFDYLGKFAVPGPLAATPLAGLSGGQRCRAALALTMLPRPHVLLLDEPTNHLDLLTVQALAAAVREWEGAVVVASHDLQFLKDTCTEVWVVEGGRVVRQQQPEVGDAVDDYASRLLERLRRKGAAERKR